MIPGAKERVVLLGSAFAVVVATAALVAVVAVRASPAGTTPGRPRAAPAPERGSSAAVGVAGPLAALRAWDRERAAAWAGGDVAALRRLYVRGSAAGQQDVAMLRSWLDRGLRVTGMSMQVVAADVRVLTPRRMVLVVTDRLVGARATRDGGRERALPGDAESTRRLVLVRQGGRWLVASAQDVGRAAARPAPSTASTSSSAKR